MHDSCFQLSVLHTEFSRIRQWVGGGAGGEVASWGRLLNEWARAFSPFLASRNTKFFVHLYPCCELDMSSSKLAIAQIYTVQTNGNNTASKPKKPSHSSHSISVNCKNTSTNYCNTFAYLRITYNTFWACLNLPEQDSLRSKTCTLL